MNDAKKTAEILKESLDELKSNHDIKKLAEYNQAYPKKTWVEKHPFIFGFIMSFIGALIGFGLAILLEEMKIYHILHLK